MIQVYTGEGKGKTTAALGLALRAAGAGKKVYIYQFLKGRYCSELASLKKIKNIKIERFGGRCFVRKPAQRDKELAEYGLKAVKNVLRRKKADFIILDEINAALNLDLLKLKDVITLIKKLPKKTELIFTGRNAHPAILKLADLISEIKEVKHYYKKGVKARKGIEF